MAAKEAGQQLGRSLRAALQHAVGRIEHLHVLSLWHPTAQRAVDAPTCVPVLAAATLRNGCLIRAASPAENDQDITPRASF
jgi:hypothetical protein